MNNIVPLSDEALTPEFLLNDVMGEVENIEAITIVTIDKEGNCKAHWSCPKQTLLCALLVKLQAVVHQVVLE